MCFIIIIIIIIIRWSYLFFILVPISTKFGDMVSIIHVFMDRILSDFLFLFNSLFFANN
jgi:hypothetical protein